jgi:antitoxin component YwqK of YwqJK toxin-antitoxin module
MTNQKTTVKNGITFKYQADGKSVFAKGKMKNGKPEGYWEWYRKDGSIKRSGTFEDGEPVGTWTTYDSEGNVYKVTEK